MKKFTDYLIEFAEVTNGAVNGGPLGAAIITPCETGVTNRKASKLKLMKFDDPFPTFDDNTDFESTNQVYSQHEDAMDDDDEMDSQPENTYKLFQQFLNWQKQNAPDVEENEEPMKSDIEEVDPESDDAFGETTPEEEPVDDLEADPENIDPNRQGIIRVVPNAHLVYKREQPDGFYEEMWIYNIDPHLNPVELKNAILADTDIPTNATQSEDGSQSYSIWTCGNAQMLKVTGIPN